MGHRTDLYGAGYKKTGILPALMSHEVGEKLDYIPTMERIENAVANVTQDARLADDQRALTNGHLHTLLGDVRRKFKRMRQKYIHSDMNRALVADSGNEVRYGKEAARFRETFGAPGGDMLLKTKALERRHSFTKDAQARTREEAHRHMANAEEARGNMARLEQWIHQIDLLLPRYA